jgi:hypothetical protein
MKAASLLVSLLAIAIASPSIAAAQPRAARVLRGLESAPAVLLDGDRAWIVGSDTDPLPAALCTDVMCRPVVRAESCVSPRCPGSGRMVFVNERIADVARWPEDRDGFHTAQAALHAEPTLAPLTYAFLPHPDPPPAPPRPARFSHGSSDRWRIELLVGAGIATGLVHISQPMWQTDLAIGFRFVPGRGMEDGLDVIYGNQFGFEARLHVLGNITGQGDDDLAVFMGLGPGFGFVFDDEPIRIPPAMSWLVPEFGVVFRTDRVPPAAYVSWSVPVALLLDEHVGLEARASLFLIDDWYAGDDAEVLASMGVQLLIR